jgi:hypothetical protein
MLVVNDWVRAITTPITRALTLKRFVKYFALTGVIAPTVSAIKPDLSSLLIDQGRQTDRGR